MSTPYRSPRPAYPDVAVFVAVLLFSGTVAVLHSAALGLLAGFVATVSFGAGFGAGRELG